jgi:hypothetical protein
MGIAIRLDLGCEHKLGVIQISKKGLG